jgi:hypothetical protein
MFTVGKNTRSQLRFFFLSSETFWFQNILVRGETQNVAVEELCFGKLNVAKFNELHLVLIYFLVLRDQRFQHLGIENWVPLKPVLGGVRGVTLVH